MRHFIVDPATLQHYLPETIEDPCDLVDRIDKLLGPDTDADAEHSIEAKDEMAACALSLIILGAADDPNAEADFDQAFNDVTSRFSMVGITRRKDGWLRLEVLNPKCNAVCLVCPSHLDPEGSFDPNLPTDEGGLAPQS